MVKNNTIWRTQISIPDSPLCPVKAYHNMISLVLTSKNSPAFCLFKHHKVLPVTYFQFQKVVQSLIKSIGKTQMSIRLTVFEEGGASWAFSVPSELIHLYGDWSSDAYKKYLRFKLDDKITVYNTHTRVWNWIVRMSFNSNIRLF